MIELIKAIALCEYMQDQKDYDLAMDRIQNLMNGGLSLMDALSLLIQEREYRGKYDRE